MEDLPLGAMGSKPSSPHTEDASVNLNLPAPLSSAGWSKERSSAGSAAVPVDLPSTGVAKNDDTTTSTKRHLRHTGPVPEPSQSTPNLQKQEGQPLLLCPAGSLAKQSQRQSYATEAAAPSIDSIGFGQMAEQQSFEQGAAAPPSISTVPAAGLQPTGSLGEFSALQPETSAENSASAPSTGVLKELGRVIVGSIGHRLQQLKQVADSHRGGSAEAEAPSVGTPGQHGMSSSSPI